MKVLKKINLGLVLAIIAIIAIVIYSVNVENNRKSAKEEIKRTCEEYIAVTNNYCILPEQYRVINQKATDVDLNEYSEQIKNEVGKYTISEKTADIQKLFILESVKNQLINTSSITTEYSRKIDRITGYKFDGSQVTVTFNTKVTIKQKYNEINQETGETSEKIKEKTLTNNGESMALENKDGKWKVVSTNFSYSINSDQDMTMNMFGM